MKEKENNSFESVSSSDKNEIQNAENKDNSINSNEDKENINKNIIRKSTLINEDKNQIKKSIIFSNTSSNIEKSNTNFISKTLTQKANLISDLTSENKNNILHTIQSYSNIKFTGEISKLNLDKDKNKIPCLYIPDKKYTKITLIKIIDQNFFEGHLTLKNNLKTEYVIFKIINDKPFYSIAPTLYYIEPDKELTINIKRFEKLSINEAKNVNDFLIIVVTHTKNKIEDVNDARIYLKKEDLFSPEYQLYKYTISLDYGYNPKLYEKEAEERENILNQYQNQLNMNKINDIEEVKTHIEKVKKEIKEYENKIKNLKSILGDLNKKNIIKQEETIFDKETYYEVFKGKIYKELDDDEENNNNDKIAFPIVILYFSICLFIGKYLKSIILKR